MKAMTVPCLLCPCLPDMKLFLPPPQICENTNDKIFGTITTKQNYEFKLITPYRFTVRQKKREVAVSSGVAHFSDKICAIVVSILRVFW